MAHRDDLIPFQFTNGTRGTANIRIIDLPDGRTLAAYANVDEEADLPVNMVSEDLFRRVCERHALDPTRVVWVEYTGYTVEVADGELGGWELVTWKGEPGEGPEWRQMTEDDWRELGVNVPPMGPDEIKKR